MCLGFYKYHTRMYMKDDVLFLCQFFYPEKVSSATLPFDTANYLVSNGYSVGVLCGYPKEYCDLKDVPIREKVNGLSIRRLKYIQLERSAIISRLLNYFTFTAKALFNLNRLKNYKIVIVYSNPPILPLIAILASYLYNTKIIFIAYDVYPEVAYASNHIKKNSIVDLGMRFINYFLFKRASAVIALTDEMREFLLSNRKNQKEDRIYTIPNWAHENKTKPDEETYKRYGYNSSQLIVTYFGNMGICQDMNTLLCAAELLKNNKDIRFLIIGHGSKKEEVREFIYYNNLTNIQQFDFLTGKDFEQAVAISSVSVVSLEKGLKGMCAPSKYYSYLQGGQPIIAIVEKDSYLAKEISNEKIGYSVEIGNAKELVEKILLMHKNDQERKSMGQRAEYLYKSKYSYEKSMEKYKIVIEKILQE